MGRFLKRSVNIQDKSSYVFYNLKRRVGETLRILSGASIILMSDGIVEITEFGMLDGKPYK